MTPTFRPMQRADLLKLEIETGAPPASDIVGVVAEIDGKRAAIVGAERWTDTSCFVHILIEDSGVLERNALLDEVARFIFVDNDKQQILGTVSSLNEASRKFQKSLGFEEIATVPCAFSDGEDLIITRLKRETWTKKRGN